MNWVGGVRRRVLLKEEERRRQEQFFASHAASAKLRGLRNSSSKNMRKDQMLDVSSSSTQRPVKLGGSHLRVRNHEGEDIVCAKIRRREPRSVNSKDLRSFGKHHNQECNRITDSEKKVSFVTSDLFKKFKIKPSSVHGPFSRYLLQLELEGVQKKIEDQKKNQQKDLKARRSRTNKKAKTSKDTWQCKEDLRAKQSCLLNETKNGCSVLNLENGISQETKNDVRTNISDAIDNVMKDPHKYRKESKDQVKSITGLKVIDASDKKEQDNLDGNEDHQVRSFREAKLNKVTHSSGKFVHSSLEISKDQEVRSVTGARINKIDAFKHKSTLVVHDYLERSINQDGQNITGTNRHEIHDSRKNTKVMNINEAKHRNLEHNYFENCEDQEVENIKEKSINEAKHKNLQHEYIEVRNLGANANVAQPSSVQGTHKFDDRTYGRKNSLTNKDMKTQNSSGLFGNDEEPNEAELSQEDVSSVGNQRKDSREAKRCTCDPRSIPAEAPEQAVPNIKNYAKFHCIDQNTGNKIENKDDVGNYIRLESNDYPHSYESICKCLPTKKPLTKKARKEEHEKHHQSMETNKETNNKKSNQEHVFSKIHRGIKSNAGCLETHSDEDLDSKSMNENPLVFDIDEMFGNRGGAGHSSRQTPLVDTPVPIEEKGTNHLKLPLGNHLNGFRSCDKANNTHFSDTNFDFSEISFISSHADSCTPMAKGSELPLAKEPCENKFSFFNYEKLASPVSPSIDYRNMMICETRNIWTINGTDSCGLEADSYKYGNPLTVKPRLSNMSRNVVKLESSHSAGKLNDKTPYMEKSYLPHHFGVCTMSGGSSNKSSKTPSEVNG